MTQTTETERPKSEPWRNADGTFARGNPGKPKGASHRFNREVLAQLGNLTNKALVALERKLEQGDLKAATFVLARFLPSERVIDVPAEPNGIADALSQGELTPTESNRLALAVKSLKEAAGIDEMRARLDEIEALLIAQNKGRG